MPAPAAAPIVPLLPAGFVGVAARGSMGAIGSLGILVGASILIGFTSPARSPAFRANSAESSAIPDNQPIAFFS
jgi:hypothetical protein